MSTTRHSPDSPARRPSSGMRRGMLRLFSLLLTFHVVALAWIFFRCESLEKAQVFLRGLVAWQTDTDPGARPVTFSRTEIDAAILLIIQLVVCVDLPQARSGHKHEVVLR